MKTSLTIALTFIFMIVFSLTAFAAQQQEAQMTGEQQREMQQGMAQQHLQSVQEARQIAGKTLKDQQGEELGKVEALLIGQDQRSSYLIVSGEDDKMYPIPTSALQRGHEEGEYAVNITKEKLQHAPSFQRDNWPKITEQQVHGYYEQQSKAGAEQQQQPGAGAVQQQPRTQQRAAMRTGEQQAAVQQIIDTGDLEGRDVVDAQGEKIGTIDAVIIGKSGELEYVILSYGGFLGFGEKLVPIPWQALQPAAEEDSYMVNINKEAVKNAPRYGRGADQPDFQNPEYQQQVHGYYTKPLIGVGEGSAARPGTQQPPTQEREKPRTPQNQ
jgi:sporulation protein YlmC with PRC-barrel domain